MNIELLVVGTYLICSLVVGLIKGSHVKDMRDYAVSKKDYPTIVLVMTIAATWYGGDSAMGVSEKVFELGIIFIILPCINCISKFIIALYIAPRMVEFKSAISVGDVVGQLYGKTARIITAIAGILLSLGYIGAQVSAMGYVLNYFLGISYITGVLAGAGVVVAYSSFGGIKSVTATDVLQFCVLIVVIPLITNIAVAHIGGYKELFLALPSDKLSIFPKGMDSNQVIALFPLFIIPFLNPAMVQRLLMSRKRDILSKSFLYTGIIDIFFYSMVGVIGLCAFILYPEIDPSLSFPQIITSLLPDPIKGLAISGLLAIIMSTADSFLNAASILAINDIIKPLVPTFSKKRELSLAKLLTALLGILSIYFSISYKSIVDLALASLDFWGPIVVVPLLAGILGFRVKENSKIFAISAFAGVASYLLWKYAGAAEIFHFGAIIPSMVVNLLVFTLLYQFDKLEKVQLRNKVIKRYFVSGFFKNLPKKLYRQMVKSTENMGNPYIAFASFALVNYALPYFMWYSPKFGSSDVALKLRLIAAVACFVMLCKDMLPNKIRKFAPLYWYALLLYCLPFMTFLQFLMSGGDITWIINMSLCVLLLIVLVDWFSFVILSISGALLAWCAYLAFLCPVTRLNMGFDNIYLAIYLTIFSVLIGYIFCRNKELVERKVKAILNQRLEEKTMDLVDALQVKDRFLRNISHELRTPLHALTNISEGLLEHWGQMDERKKLYLTESISSNAIRLNELMKNMLLFTELQNNESHLHKKKINLVEFVEKFILEYDNVDIKRRVKNAHIYADKDLLTYIFKELIENAFKYGSNASPVTIEIFNEKLIVANYGSHVPQDEIESIFRLFNESSITEKKSGGKGVGLSIVKSICDKHNWKISVQSTSKTTSFIVEFK